jgi:hypothetical protein
MRFMAQVFSATVGNVLMAKMFNFNLSCSRQTPTLAIEKALRKHPFNQGQKEETKKEGSSTDSG